MVVLNLMCYSTTFALLFLLRFTVAITSRNTFSFRNEVQGSNSDVSEEYGVGKAHNSINSVISLPYPAFPPLFHGEISTNLLRIFEEMNSKQDDDSDQSESNEDTTTPKICDNTTASIISEVSSPYTKLEIVSALIDELEKLKNEVEQSTTTEAAFVETTSSIQPGGESYKSQISDLMKQLGHEDRLLMLADLIRMEKLRYLCYLIENQLNSF
ncbi:hypothetical protein ACOME3_001052 [Neoechinorhynchus agilis]